VGGDGDTDGRLGEQLAEQVAVGVVDGGAAAVGEVGRFVVGPFHQPDRARRVREASHVVGRTLQVGLEAEPHAATVSLAERLVGADRRFGRSVILHVEPEDRSRLGGHLGDPVEVVAEDRLVDAEAEL
jgi:hypothetical protein